eukprot:scaffold30029_cov34-Phaeocystis_antarctica.AAC.3
MGGKGGRLWLASRRVGFEEAGPRAAVPPRGGGPCMPHACPMHAPCTHHAHTMHTPCAHHAHTMRTPCTHHAHTMNTPCTHHAHSAHAPPRAA